LSTYISVDFSVDRVHGVAEDEVRVLEASRQVEAGWGVLSRVLLDVPALVLVKDGVQHPEGLVHIAPEQLACWTCKSQFILISFSSAETSLTSS
jgi:hypothetical protein